MIQNENKKKGTTILLIIILLLLLTVAFGIGYLVYNMSSESVTPTGNVDIFEIKCDINCDCTNSETEAIDTNTSNANTSTSTNSNSSNNSSSSNTSSSGNSSTNTSTSSTNSSTDTSSTSSTEDTSTGEFTVSDANVIWNNVNNLRIFANPVYDNDSIIAPESTNVYQFVVANSTSYNISYSLTFLEENEYGINMLYRLKDSNGYLVGDDDTWVSYDELLQSDITLNSSESNTYYLEWKWFESDNDTQVGTSIDASYKLNVTITAVSI